MKKETTLEPGNGIFVEGIDFPLQKADADSQDIYCDDEATLAAQKAFHITYLFPWQRIVIANILDSAEQLSTSHKNSLVQENSCSFCDPCTSLLQDESGDAESELMEISKDDYTCNGRQIVLLPTGAGKSLCFLTPALLLDGPTLVLYPLLALMADQKRRMDEGGMVSVVFRGQQTPEEREENFRIISSGAKIILANPEVLQNKQLVNRLSSCHIAHIAIDEAHCVSEWGDSFRPAYLTLGEIIKQLNVSVVTAFTATASPQVLNRVAEVLFNGQAHIVRSDSDRPNIHYTVINAYAKKRAAFKLAVQEQKPLIVFCGTRKHAEDMARELDAYYQSRNAISGETTRARFYHAGLSKEEKTEVEKWFYPKSDAILCCTCAFGMGVDKKDIHCVIHLDVPSTAEAYIQEAGRGGRDGSIAKGILIWSHTDSIKNEQYDIGSRERVLKTFAESTTCRRQVLLDALGGEQAACDGCDVCERHGPAPIADDALFALHYISRHRKQFLRDDLYARLEKEFNKHDLKEFGMNIWEHGDIAELLQQLESAGFIRTCLFPWRGRIESVSFSEFKKGKHVLSLYRSATWQRFFLMQEKTLKLKKKFASPFVRMNSRFHRNSYYVRLYFQRSFLHRRQFQQQAPLQDEYGGPSEASFDSV